MKLLERRRAAALAAARFDTERVRWHVRSSAMRSYVHAHRAALSLAGGFAAGIVAGLLPFRGIVRAGGMAFSAISFAMRLPAGLLVADPRAQAATNANDDTSASP